ADMVPERRIMKSKEDLHIYMAWTVIEFLYGDIGADILCLDRNMHRETSPDARSWFYGDDDSNERLRILSEYPDMIEASPTRDESKIETQKLFPRLVRVIGKCPSDLTID
ncbi:hypothetical protein Tco_0046695, partial [Tanacetum coccineum]